MSLRKKIRKHPQVVACGAIAVILGIVAFLIYPLFAAPKKFIAPDNVYFYDLSNGKVFPVPSRAIPPMDRDEAGAKSKAVRAYVFSCTDCAIEADRFVGYLLKLTDEGKRKFETTPLGKTGPFPAPTAWSSQAILPGVVLGEIPVSQPSAQPGTPAVPPLGAKVKPGSTAFQIATVPARLDTTPHWFPLSGSDAAGIFKQVRARCGPSKIPKTCDPPNTPD